MGASIALSHHESLDGNGYPSGLRGADIPIEGRIVAVADILDALLSERPYKVAWPLHRALEELENLQGSRLDPACVQALMNRTDDVVEVRTVATGRGSRGG
jgi:putative two-component system response regulator